jgi:hypothetical protein
MVRFNELIISRCSDTAISLGSYSFHKREGRFTRLHGKTIQPDMRNSGITIPEYQAKGFPEPAYQSNAGDGFSQGILKFFCCSKDFRGQSRFPVAARKILAAKKNIRISKAADASITGDRSFSGNDAIANSN